MAKADQVLPRNKDPFRIFNGSRIFPIELPESFPAVPHWVMREQLIRNVQILPHYQQLTLVEVRERRVSASVFVRAAVGSWANTRETRETFHG
jgi:hypothetical protein